MQPLLQQLRMQRSQIRAQVDAIWDLRGTTQPQNNLLVKLLNGTVSLPGGGPGGGSIVTGSFATNDVFQSHVASREYSHSVLLQDVKRGGVTINRLVFTVLQDAASFVTK